MVRHLFFNGFHPVVPWLGFLLVGMVLGRRDMRDTTTRRRVFVVGASVAIVAEVSSRLLVPLLTEGADAATQESMAALFGTAPMPPMPLYFLAGAGTASAAIAVCISLGLRFGEARWLRPLIATGQLALSLYVGHVLIGMGTLEALGKLGNQSLPFSLLASLIFCAGGVLFASLWRRRFERGPVEALMRRWT